MWKWVNTHVIRYTRGTSMRCSTFLLQRPCLQDHCALLLRHVLDDQNLVAKARRHPDMTCHVSAACAAIWGLSPDSAARGPSSHVTAKDTVGTWPSPWQLQGHGIGGTVCPSPWGKPVSWMNQGHFQAWVLMSMLAVRFISQGCVDTGLKVPPGGDCPRLGSLSERQSFPSPFLSLVNPRITWTS